MKHTDLDSRSEILRCLHHVLKDRVRLGSFGNISVGGGVRIVKGNLMSPTKSELRARERPQVFPVFVGKV